MEPLELIVNINNEYQQERWNQTLKAKNIKNNAPLIFQDEDEVPSQTASQGKFSFQFQLHFKCNNFKCIDFFENL